MPRRPSTTLLALALLAGCASTTAPPPVARDDGTAAMASQVRFVHGSPPHGYPGPWALAGYRIGANALQRLHTTREGAWDLLGTHRSPREARYTCMTDGLLAP